MSLSVDNIDQEKLRKLAAMEKLFLQKWDKLNEEPIHLSKYNKLAQEQKELMVNLQKIKTAVPQNVFAKFLEHEQEIEKYFLSILDARYQLLDKIDKMVDDLEEQSNIVNSKAKALLAKSSKQLDKEIMQHQVEALKCKQQKADLTMERIKQQQRY